MVTFSYHFLGLDVIRLNTNVDIFEIYLYNVLIEFEREEFEMNYTPDIDEPIGIKVNYLVNKTVVLDLKNFSIRNRKHLIDYYNSEDEENEEQIERKAKSICLNMLEAREEYGYIEEVDIINFITE